jgi:hypothetical protein
METDKRSADLCQIETAPATGRMRRPGALYVPMRIGQELRSRGVRVVVRRLVEALRRRSVGGRPIATPFAPDAVLHLRPGELVRVKTLQEIRATLDGKGKNRGLVFTPEMIKHCGKEYRVFKRLDLMFDEYHKSQRRVRDTVLLENVFCTCAGLGCDRSCFLYWREVWLRRVDNSSNGGELANTAAIPPAQH